MGFFVSFFNKYSENIAGVISLIASIILLVFGDTHSTVAAILFLIAEISLSRYGHKTWGYSVGALFFMSGDLFLSFMPTIEPFSYLQLSLLLMGFAWFLGVLRYPCEKIFPHKPTYSLALQNGCGLLNIIAKIPSFIFAVLANQYLLAGVLFAWGVSDILAGRLQEKIAYLWVRS